MTTLTPLHPPAPRPREPLGRSLRVALTIVGAVLALLAGAGASRAERPKPSEPPVNTQTPSVSGQTTDGEPLVADRGEWSGDTPIAYAYQWRRCDSSGAACSEIAGATGKSYVLRPDDVGSRLRVTVTAKNEKGSASAESAPTGVVSAAAPVSVGIPSISGVPEVGQTLTGRQGTWTGTPAIEYAWQWRRCDASGAGCADIPDATGPSYQLSPEDEAKALRLRVTATNAAGSASADSDPTAAVAPSSGGPKSNVPPEAAFVFFPAHPVVGEEIDLVSISSDPDGALAQQQWDFDEDGQFDDASGVRATHAFGSAGAHTVRLRVTDSSGAVDVSSQVIDVSAPPPPIGPVSTPAETVSPVVAPLAQPPSTGAAPPQSPLLAMSPFPIVRIVGQLVSNGVLIRVVSVRAPRGAVVEVRCRGALCPVRRLRTKLRSGRLRLRRLEGLLGAGARIELFVRQPGRVGKYTRFRARPGRLPARLDACLPPGAPRPARCAGA